ncbi:hypothetical protein GYH30_016784 [Glycine max]|nr:hypothetical protein GYH30_016784 [Glycine max]
MLPCLKYGSQCHLHCTKLPSNSFVDAFDLHHRTNLSCYCRHSLLMPTHKHTSQFLVGDEGIDAVREKLMLDLKTEANRMKDATQFSARSEDVEFADATCSSGRRRVRIDERKGGGKGLSLSPLRMKLQILRRLLLRF